MFYGEQLNHTDAEVVYVDFSLASMKVAKNRAILRKLKNIIWVKSWIEDIRVLGLGWFEQTSCSGVLHHLKKPLVGLKQLTDNLSKKGGLTLMVYAANGRTGIYQIQKLMNVISLQSSDMKIEIQHARDIVDSIPKSNIFISNLKLYQQTNVDIYDLFLHKRDIAFSIMSLFDWIARSGLYFVCFDNPSKKYNLEIKNIIPDLNLKRLLFKFHYITQWAISEIVQGVQMKHEFFLSKTNASVAGLHDKNIALYIHGNPIGLKRSINNNKNLYAKENRTLFAVRISEVFYDSLRSNIDLPKHIIHKKKPEIIFQFEQSNFTIFLINKLLKSNEVVAFRRIAIEYKNRFANRLSSREIHEQQEHFYNSIKDTGIALLRKQHIADFPKTSFATFYQILGRK